MADSDNTRVCPSVTRRLALCGGAAAVCGVFGEAAQARGFASLDALSAIDDPAVALWRDWETTHEQVQRLGRRQQELEVELGERVDCLGTLVRVRGGEPVYVCSPHALDRLIGERTDMAAIRLQAEGELAQKQARYEAVAEEIGYFSSMKAEQQAFQRAEAILEAMAATRAVSLAGVAGKLDAVVRWGEAWAEHRLTFPWQQIRSAHRDLVALGRQTAPDAFFPEYGL
ncbi:MAG: hypothetical protein ACT6RL_21570 [Neoaquamicrobium sediminum]|uniref:hypothetical protein n=1 Tax=Neoaquamicrobium sediminum TaxID=1849104 RepID=UPI004036218F